MRSVIFAILLLALGCVSSGCFSHTYDGSEEFGKQLPQYRYDDDNPTPDYFHPGDSDAPAK